MKILECAREQDVIAAIVSRRWPERSDAELRDHVTDCAICRDVAEVAVRFGVEQEAAWHEARVPTAAHVWWRTQMRVRQEATRAAAWPIAVIQGVAAASAAGLAVAAIGFGWSSGVSSWESSAAGVRQLADAALSAVLSVAVRAPELMLLCGAIAAGLVLMPVAVYLALSE